MFYANESIRPAYLYITFSEETDVKTYITPATTIDYYAWRYECYLTEPDLQSTCYM